MLMFGVKNSEFDNSHASFRVAGAVFGSGGVCFWDSYRAIGQATYGDWGGSVNLLRGWGG